MREWLPRLWHSLRDVGHAHDRHANPQGSVELRFFEPARFVMTCGVGRPPVNLTLKLLSMRLEGGAACSEIHIRDHGLHIEAVLDGRPDHLLIYLGNYFWVPGELRRAGVASACIAAMRQAYQLAAYGAVNPRQPTVLEGYFVDRGVDWARAMCDGRLPTKAAPARMDLARLGSADQRLKLVEAPKRTSLGSACA